MDCLADLGTIECAPINNTHQLLGCWRLGKGGSQEIQADQRRSAGDGLTASSELIFGEPSRAYSTRVYLLELPLESSERHPASSMRGLSVGKLPPDGGNGTRHGDCSDHFFLNK